MGNQLSKDSIEKLFESFQGRKVIKRVTKNIEKSLPKEVYPFGRAVSVLYYCDKRDPGDPFGEGAQGHWKFFIHKHSKGVYVYSNKVDTKSNSLMFEDSIRPIYPETCAWLGELKEIVIENDKGNEETIRFKNMNLWVWDDHVTLMALPMRGKVTEVLIWAGGKLKVTGRGIEH